MGEINLNNDPFEESNDSTIEEEFLLVRKRVIELMENPKLAVDELFIKAIVQFKCGDYEESLATLEHMGNIIQKLDDLVWGMLEARNTEFSDNIFPFIRRIQNN